MTEACRETEIFTEKYQRDIEIDVHRDLQR